MLIKAVIAACALFYFSLSAEALEVYRNGHRYDISASLPSGASFREDGVDRKFEIGGVSGNLRLIQDSYGDCTALIDERQRNWVKYGFSEASDRYASTNECSISIHNPASDETVTSFYIRIDDCDCYSALHFRFKENARPDFAAAAPSIVASVRQNNGGAPEPAVAAIGGTLNSGGAAPKPVSRENGFQNATKDGIGRITSALATLPCMPAAKDKNEEADRALKLVSAWTGRKIDDLARNAGVPSLGSHISYDFPAGDPGNIDLIEATVSANDSAVTRLENDIATHGASVCGVLYIALGERIDSLYGQQKNFNSVYHGYLKAAQQLTLINGCASAEPDGAFGPSSRSSWNKLLTAIGKPQIGDNFTPTMSDLIDTAAVPVSDAACGPNGAQGPGARIAVLPFLVDDGFGGWLRKRTPTLENAMNRIAAAGEWTPFQQQLALSVMGKSYGENDSAVAGRLAQIFKYGIGVARNDQAAGFWQSAAARDPSLYQRYATAIETGNGVEPLTEDLIRTYTWSEDYRSKAVSGPMVFDSSLTLTLERRTGLARFSHLVMKYPEALRIVAETAPAEVQYMLAVRLLDGASVLGKGTDQARVLLEAASRSLPYAASHLAFMLSYGNGGTADQTHVQELLKFAAGKDDPFALYLLARRAERDRPEAPEEALKWYKRLFAQDAGEYVPFAGADLVANRIMAGSLALASPEGKKLIEDLAKRKQDFAGLLASMYLCADCGGAIDYAEAAKWLRLMRDAKVKQSGVVLYRLLQKFPDLAESGREGIDGLIRANADENGKISLGWDADIAAFIGLVVESGKARLKTKGQPELLPSFVESVLADLCKPSDNGPSYCDEAAKFLASGAFGADLVAVGLKRLEETDSIALTDALAAYGDFKGALARGLRAEKDLQLETSSIISRETSDQEGLRLDPNDLRAPTLRRLIARRDPSDMSTLPKGFTEYLNLLARNGDTQARDYLRLIAAPPVPPAPVQPNISAAEATFEAVKARGGLSMSLVNAARVYSSALQTSGDTNKSLELELTALAAERQLDQVVGLGSGPLQGKLTTVCHLSKASERVFGLGADGIALVLAKDAINELQNIRRDLSTIPERLQGCFRDLVADNYRWLADLLVRQNRLSEAEFVLSLLKDFEAFQFAGRDNDFTGDSFRQLPYSAEEQELKDALDALQLPTVTDVRRREELLAKQQLQGLTQAEAAQLADIQTRLQAAEAGYQSGLKRILEAAANLKGKADPAAALAETESIQKTLLGKLTEKAVAIHYLVMPDRLNIILTTPSDRKSFTIRTWNGAPFTEAGLNEKLEEYHAVVSDPGYDPKKRSRELYDLLFAPLEQDLKAAQPSMLLVSLDKRLRYLPYQSLYDGSEYLIERYAVSLLTSSESEISGQKTTDVPFAGLGMTQETENFLALPGVAVELDGIIKGDNNFGLFDGEVYMDKAFNKPALIQSLRIGENARSGLGVVHISSHFSLGDSDKDSFLLLGTGEHLSLADIKNDPKDFNFDHVELLTLSACETGRANPDRDGREIESLAKITGDRGAKSTIASLWPVADSSTAILMQRFYELRELGDMSKAQALAMVQREFIHGDVGSPANLTTRSVVYETAQRFNENFRETADGIDPGFSHPAYWAPFVLTGNWR
ncbi:CHAT domain-containing protein [Roseibium aggregatum]|uniref:CHAT domain-containing protein n=1 Tax=Roseibium aggregatum TaxID=187304 RepID=A0A926NXD7_9HYPH|nr:CHAT domain-containing protein [Roseibium aggregatum]MBD1545523.1 CHAT domain-containing protein [Roseibium aggregatum]